MRKDASRCSSERAEGWKWKIQRCSRYSSNVQENTPAATKPATARGPIWDEPRYSMYSATGTQIAITCQGRTRDRYFSTQGTVNISGLPRRGRSSFGCGAR